MPTVLLKLLPEHPHIAETLAGLWNAALGAEWAITPRAVTYNLLPAAGCRLNGRLALVDGQPAGFVLAEVSGDSPENALGWVPALAVDPRFQRRGLGARLLGWAESWLKEMGCRMAWLGGGARPFAPGVPEPGGNAAFFAACGYQGEELTWDMARSLRGYAGAALSRRPPADVRPARAEDLPRLFDLLHSDFPYWESDYRQFIADGGRPEDIIVLYTPEGLRAFCWITLEDSTRPLDRFFPNRLPRPWGQLGSIGSAPEVRGQGYAGVMIDCALRHLQSKGVDGCVIDWTGLLDFYAKFGFTVFHAYRVLNKAL